MMKHLIGQVAFLHGTEFVEVMKLDYKANGVGTDLIHPRFIAMMIRLGDLLDLDDGRFTAVFQKMIPKVPEVSKVHMHKHASIRHFLIDSDGIEIVADCDAPETYRATKSWIDWIEKEIKNLATNWSKIVQEDFIGGPPSLNKQSIFLKGKNDKSEQTNLRFNISTERAFDILEGSGIYDNELVFVRELVQNALDASKIQMWADICSGIYDSILESEKGIKDYAEIKTFDDIPAIIWRNYPIKISVNIDSEDKSQIVFSIEDRGCGFKTEDLDALTQVGESYGNNENKTKIISTMPTWLKPTGAFGLGMQSVFLVTNELEIYTKVDGETPKKITAVSRKKNGYITVEEYEGDIKRGSIIKFNIKEEIYKRFIEKEQEIDPFVLNNHYSEIFMDKLRTYFYDEIAENLFEIYYNGKIKDEQEYYWKEKYLSNEDNKAKSINFIDKGEDTSKVRPIGYFISAYNLIENVDIDESLIKKSFNKAFSAISYNNKFEPIPESFIFDEDSILIVRCSDGSCQAVGFVDNDLDINIYKECVNSDTSIKEMNNEANVINFMRYEIYELYINKYFYVDKVVRVKEVMSIKAKIGFAYDENEEDFDDIEYVEVVQMKRKNNDIIQMNSDLQNEVYDDIILSLLDNKMFHFMDRSVIYPIYPYGKVLSVSKVPNDFEISSDYDSNDSFCGNAYIISPFIFYKDIPFDRETKELVRWLKENMGLEELAKWVVENSAQPEQYKPNINQVMKSYEDLIGEYQRLYKLKQDEEEKLED